MVKAPAIVIAHRGASGYLPEHTLATYFMGAEQQADFLEPDLVMTRDGVLVARHENEISTTTDVATHPEFAERRTTKTVDGVELSGWFTEDFTLVELKRLRARERLPELRPANARFDGMFAVPTFDEVLELAKSIDRLRLERARAHGAAPPPPIGVYPETKHPSYFAQLGLAMERGVIDALERHGFGPDGSPAFIQSFEVANLKALRGMTRLPLIQLIEPEGRPFDFTASGDSRTYADLLTPAGLAGIRAYANGIGVPKSTVLRVADGVAALEPTQLVADAHAATLLVHVWTFRAENYFLPTHLRHGSDLRQHGDLAAELGAALAAGIDGFFADQPDLGVAIRASAAGR
ncbi:MAG: glycerophosphodiester phosphodiesterase [Steroidobacteraceae bacterium]